jgi:hypothetical protein
VSYPQPLTPEEKLADAKKLLSLPRIVVICAAGPSRGGFDRRRLHTLRRHPLGLII